MGRNEAATWGIAGAIAGTILIVVFQPNLTLLGAILGAALGYMIGKSVK